MMNYHQSMGYNPSTSQPGHGHSVACGQVPMNGNGGGMSMAMGNGGGMLTHQPHQGQPLQGGMNHGGAQHLQQQAHQQGSNRFPTPEEDYAYWAPPAPRLTAAAVRAARMEALYPYQALYAGYHQPHHGPVPTPYGAYNQQSQQQQQQHHNQSHQSQAHHHAQLEHQLMLHHQLSKLHVYPPRSMAPQEAPPQQHLPPQVWEHQQRQNYASQAAYGQPQQPAYEWDPNVQAAPAPVGSYQAQAPPHLQHQPDHRHHHQPDPYAQQQGGWEGYGAGAGMNQGGGPPAQQEWISSQRGAVPAAPPQQPTWQGGFQNGEAHHYHQPIQQEQYGQERQPDVTHVENSAPKSAGQQAPPTDSGPAPPSPDTLDRSAVPIASLGAEITWAACAALLEPSLLHSSIASRSPSDSSKRLSATSSPSVQTPASLWNSGYLSQSGEWSSTSMQARNQSPNGVSASQRSTPGPRLASNQRDESKKGRHLGRVESFGNSSSPNSSASSSEPGTPPSERDGPEAGSLADAHGLGLAGVAMTGEDECSPVIYSSANKPQGAFFGASRLQQRENSVRARSHSSTRAAANAATVEKMRSGVHSVLNLISPEWKWSRNDHTLMSLTDHSPLAAQSIQQSSPSSSRRISRSGSTSSSRRSSSHGNGSMSGSGVLGMVGSPRPSTDPNHHPSPSPSADTSPAFKRFVHQVLAQTLLSPTAFLLALLFVVRVPTLVTNSDGSIDQEALQLFAQPPSAAPFKLLTLGLMISNKHLDDNTFLNKTWNEVTGIPLDELNRMERYFLKRCGFEITVPDEVWSSFVLRVRKREESKMAINMSNKRLNLQNHVRVSVSTSTSSTSEMSSAEQCSKRLIPALDEMLANLGHLPPLDLSEPCIPVISPVSSDKVEKFRNSGLEAFQRPSLSHHHCHSAPPSAFGASEDVFEQESGPYRPYSARTSSDLSLKDYYSPPKSAPIPSHDQFGYNLGNGFLASLGYRNVIERVRSDYAQELRSN